MGPIRATTCALALLAAAATAVPATGCGPRGSDAGTDTGVIDSGTDAGPGDPYVDIMTWNIEQFPMTALSVTEVAAIIESLNVDLVGVQEITNQASFDMLVDALPGWEGVLAQDDGSAFIRVGILYRTSVISVSNLQTLFFGDWYPFPRAVLKADVVAAPPGTTVPFEFVFLVMHLKAGVGAEDATRRELACEMLEAWVAGTMAASSATDFVLAGDWNDRITDPPSENVFQVFLDQPGTFTFLTAPLANKGYGTLISFESFIDHILVTNDALDEYGTGGTTEVMFLDSSWPDYRLNASDHRPVISRFGPLP